MNARPAGIVEVVVNVVLGLAFVHSGAAAWLWTRVERDVPWRTGPTAEGVLAFLLIYWCAWLVMSLITRRVALASAARGFIAACVIVAIQVLVATMWLPATLIVLLLGSLLNACIVREPSRRAITAAAWSGAGVALATLLIHPYFIGSPLFIMRLTVVMTVWDWIGERLGVTPRLLRFVPSLYAGSSSSSASSRTAFHARVAR